MSSINVRLLPDNSGKVRIHWFRRDPNGPITTPAGVLSTGIGLVNLGGVKGCIACTPQLKDLTPQIVNGVMITTLHSDDVRGATCPECLDTDEAKQMIANLKSALQT